jgi:hypothetical protein
MERFEQQMNHGKKNCSFCVGPTRQLYLKDYLPIWLIQVTKLTLVLTFIQQFSITKNNNFRNSKINSRTNSKKLQEQ